MNKFSRYRSGSLSLIVMLLVSVLQGPLVTAQQTPAAVPAEKKPVVVPAEKKPVVVDEEKKPVVVAVPAAKKDGLLRFAFVSLQSV